jgi:putative flippase GtrA
VSDDVPPGSTGSPDKLLLIFERLPRPVRFLGVGGFGLVTDLSVFTVLAVNGMHPLLARLFSLAAATLVTWRLNRALTFDRSHRHQGDEAARYAGVTVTAQGTSYAIFALLILTALASLPQVALLIGAAAGAVIGYFGHRCFAFAPKFPPAQQKASHQ